MSIYGYIQCIGVNRIIALFERLVERLVFDLQSFVGKKCTQFGTITVVPSFEYLSCSRLNFSHDKPLNKVSMTFYVDSFETDKTNYNSANSWATKSTGVVYCMYHSNAKVFPTVTNQGSHKEL